MERIFDIDPTLIRRAEFYPSRLRTVSVQHRHGRRPRDTPQQVLVPKLRTLFMPNEAMKAAHATLVHDLRRLWDINGPTPWVTGARPGTSPLKNALLHAKHRHGIKLDLRNAYDAVQPVRLIEIIGQDYAMAHGRLLASEEELRFVEAVIGRYCACFGGTGIRTGAPASADLFNRYALELLDRPILELASRHGFAYTRYLDDLTFSAHRHMNSALRRELREIIFKAGFEVNWRKAEIFDLSRQPSVVFNGIGMRPNGRPFVPRPYLEKVKRLIWVAMYSQRSGIVVTSDVANGHIGVCLHIMGRDPRLWNATDRKFIELVTRFRRHFGQKPLKLHA